jgi:uncharacterized surface protein with fasciclin (FAS1) repeats
MKKLIFLSTIPRLAAALLITALGTIYSCTTTNNPAPAPVATTPGSSTVVTPGSSTTAAPGSTGGTVLPFSDYLAATPELSLLRVAVTRAGLGTALNAGQITVFAPNNDAFKAAGYADEAAINAIAPETLKQILQYHVLNDKVDYPAFPTEVSTIYQTQLANAKVYVYKTSAGVVTVNNATVTKPNQVAVNTVVHIINRVLMPNTQNPVDYAKTNTNLSFFAAAVAQAGSALQTTLSQTTKNGITVFAPTNEAFKAAGYADEAAIKAADATKLATLLSYHVVPSSIFTPAFKDNSDLTTLQGGTLKVKFSEGKVTLTGKGNGTNVSTVTQGDVALGNGVVHIIDRVLLP